ncbi:MAG: hypothetical protein Q8K71_17495 [Polaromonas sp.]|nr:hypothetical protein [Polaromonas sp.]MDP3752132.1 hypothetical protein [Polaromonas sp.]
MSAPVNALPLGRSLSWRKGLRWLQSFGWPALVGVLLFVAGSLLAVTSYRLRAVEAALHAKAARAGQSLQKAATDHTRPLPAILPLPESYIADLAQIFDIAKHHGVVLGSGDYSDSDRMAIPVDIRVVDLRFNEGYAKLKEFLAALLNGMPHLAVQELRIERKDNLAVRHQVTLKLALVYASERGKPQPILSSASGESRPAEDKRAASP